jgi:hypothetical protein
MPTIMPIFMVTIMVAVLVLLLVMEMGTMGQLPPVFLAACEIAAVHLPHD